jgi:hypothetical protein
MSSSPISLLIMPYARQLGDSERPPLIPSYNKTLAFTGGHRNALPGYGRRRIYRLEHGG